MLTLVLIGVWALAFKIESATSNSALIVVPADYPTIQEAISAANDGDTIYVKAGTYHENVIVNKCVSLIGEDKETTVLNGDEAATVIQVVESCVTITGFKIKTKSYKWSEDVGIYVENTLDVNITNNNIITKGIGIYLYNSCRTTVVGNALTNNFIGLDIEFSDFNTISNNSISNNIGAIYLGSSYSNLIKDNSIVKNELGIELNGRWNDIHNNIIILNKLHGVWLADADNNTLTRNTITNNGIGIQLRGDNNTIAENTFAFNECGLLLHESSDNKICYNNFFENRHQVNSVSSYNVWDDDYPSGGNYWSDFKGVDKHNGPYQNKTGSDGIGDTSYIISKDNNDQFPFLKPLLAHEYDLAVTVWSPTSITTGTSTIIQVAVCNLGSSNEANVHLQLLIDSVLVESEIISELASGLVYTLSYSWTPTTEGICNITACVVPIPREYTIINNVESVHTNVYVLAEGPTRISLKPSEIQVKPGTTFTVVLEVVNVIEMYSWQVKLCYNTVVLKLIDARYPQGHVFEGKAFIPEGPVIRKNYVMIGSVILGSSQPNFNGTGTLCEIEFLALTAGSSELNVNNADTFLVKFGCEKIPCEKENSNVTVMDLFHALKNAINSATKVDLKETLGNDDSVEDNSHDSYRDNQRVDTEADVDNKNGTNDNNVFAREQAVFAILIGAFLFLSLISIRVSKTESNQS